MVSFTKITSQMVETMLGAMSPPGSDRLAFSVARNLGVLSHHLKCEMKSPHLVDFS